MRCSFDNSYPDIGEITSDCGVKLLYPISGVEHFIHVPFGSHNDFFREMSVKCLAHLKIGLLVFCFCIIGVPYIFLLFTYYQNMV
jgi:hypothetical protein